MEAARRARDPGAGVQVHLRAPALLHVQAEVGFTERTLAREFGDYFTRTAVPTWRVDDFNMSSVSQAS